MDLLKLYWLLQAGRPVKRLSVYELRSNPHHFAEKPVFFLSTGRCGTKWFSDLLESDRRLAVFHHPIPSLASQSKRIHELQLKRDHVLSPEEILLIKEIFWASREDHLRYAYKTGKRYVETNNYITFFASELAEIFPSAKFIHLVRHPGEFIRSGVSRDYYGGGVTDLMRPVPVKGKYAHEWDTFGAKMKVAWLWNTTNTFIEDFLNGISEERKFFMNFNDLDKNSVSELVEFVEADVSLRKVSKLLPRKKNAQSTYTIDAYDSWDVKEKEEIEVLTSRLSKKYGYSF
jgi:hypothetical protein